MQTSCRGDLQKKAQTSGDFRSSHKAVETSELAPHTAMRQHDVATSRREDL